MSITELGISQIASEKRAASYTDAVVDAIIRHASGSLTLNPAGLGVLEAASGMLSRALALATVTPSNGRTASLTASVRARIGRDLLRQGQSVHVIHTGRDGLELIPAHAVDVSGAPFEEWRYKVDISAPDGTRTMDLPASSVLHVRLASDAASPWSGVPPLAWAVTSARLGTALEVRLGQEADMPTGAAISTNRDPGPPTDDDGEDEDPSAGLKRDLASLKGELALIESFATGGGEHRNEGTRKDFAVSRLGANPPATLPALRGDVEMCLASALGLPAALLSPNSDGTAAREGLRRWLHTTLMPIAEVLCEEVRAKLETPCSLTFERLEAGDIAGRARAFSQMRRGGLRVEAAARLAGLEGVGPGDVDPDQDEGTPVQAGFRA